MKRHNLDAKIIAAAPLQKQRNSFVARTMERIQKAKQHETFSANTRTTNTPKRSLFMKIKALHGAGLAIAAISTVILLSSVVYAAVRFTPGLLNITGKKTDSQGRTEYRVDDSEDCHQRHVIKPEAYALKSNAPKDLTDDDVLKILQARCEMNWVANFASQTWPTYGQNKDWKDGDKIFYTRPDVMAKVESISKKDVSVTVTGLKKTYQTFDNKDLEVYVQGVKADLSAVKPGDSVFIIERVQETYISKYDIGTQPSQPKTLGVVAVVKMSLPEKYYNEYQGYIQEVFACMGNEQDRCENGPTIDVFPREGGEGAMNPKFRMDKNTVMKEIAGKLTAMNETRMTIETTSGRTFTVNLPKKHLDDYHTKWAPNYTDIGDKANVKIGSIIDVMYGEKANIPETTINEDMIMRVSLSIPNYNPKAKN